MAIGGFDAPSTLFQVETVVDGFEAEELVHEERRTHARRRIAERHPLDGAIPFQVIPTDVSTALAAHMATPRERDSGRHRRFRHKSLLI
jgi:hypothetical protein